MASTDLFKFSPIVGVDLFNYPMNYRPCDMELETRLPIGKQIEEQLLASLQGDKRFTVLAYGVQVQANGITLGELDFIIKDHLEDITFHLELVHKFYIYDKEQGDEEIDRWTGPNYRDKLTYKLDKLRDKQFPLLHHPATLPYLETLGVDPNAMQQRLCFKAELYQALGTETKQLDLLNTKAIQGTYISFDEFKKTLDSTSRYFVCQKQQWIQDERTCRQWTSDKECLDSLETRAEDGRAVMIWTQQDAVCERKFILFDHDGNNSNS